MEPFVKDPNEILDYQIDWTARLNSDTIVSSTWIVQDGIVKNSDAFITTATTVWLASGTTGQTYSLTNRVTTTGGRTMDQTIKVKIKDR